jgi:8-oxo-dGTP pyrophosphatase MutT (NUDIX family)
MDEIIPAATVVLMRDRPYAPPELLMVERAAQMRFAGGAWVFPGGRVDPGDRVLAATLRGDPVIDAARIAAIREAVEEVGVAPGISGLTERALRTLRAALLDGVPIGVALEQVGAQLDAAALVTFARWLPRGVHHRIFDTHFFLARWQPDMPEPRVDRTENSRLHWISAADALASADRGDTRIIFPTRRNLERLARFASYAEAIADAAHFPVRTVTPWREVRDGVEQLCIPDDLGYPVTSEPMTSAMRG